MHYNQVTVRVAYSMSRSKSPRYMLFQGKFCNIGNCITVKKCCLNAGMCEDAGCSVAFLVAFRSSSLEALFGDSECAASKF